MNPYKQNDHCRKAVNNYISCITLEQGSICLQQIEEMITCSKKTTQANTNLQKKEKTSGNNTLIDPDIHK